MRTPLPRTASLAAGLAALAALVLVQASGADRASGAAPPSALGDGVPTGRLAAPRAADDGEERPLVWSDEFDGPAGAGVDRSRWRVETGAGWGQGELQAYTDRPENISTDGAGNLAITMRQEATVDAKGREAAFTSARIQTLEASAVGRLEARMQVPAGIGLWSAFWTLGGDYDQVGWPRSGEIDVVEVYDDATALESVVHASRLAADGTASDRWRALVERPVPGGLAGGWHVYAVDITPEQLTFSLDGDPHLVVRRSDRATGEEWPFDQPQYVLLNLAMSRWLPPGQVPPLPATLLVDYVRAYPPPST